MVSGSGERERVAGRSLSAAWIARARSYWPLVISKPGSGRHGARGHSRRLKCPFWMSSTQWGMWESDCAEGAVAGGLWAASATASATLWGPADGIGGHNLCKQRSGVRASPIAHLHPRSQGNTASSRATVSMSYFCLPSHPPFNGCDSYGGSLWWSAGAGSGSGVLAGLCPQPGLPVRALIGY